MMKRLFYYIPELMLAAGLLTAIGIYLSCTVPLGHACMANVAWGNAELYGKWMQVRPRVEVTQDKKPARFSSGWCFSDNPGEWEINCPEIPIGTPGRVGPHEIEVNGDGTPRYKP